MWTASLGVLGALSALSLDSVQSLEARTAWILPFSAGGFLNIGIAFHWWIKDILSLDGNGQVRTYRNSEIFLRVF